MGYGLEGAGFQISAGDLISGSCLELPIRRGTMMAAGSAAKGDYLSNMGQVTRGVR